MFPHRFSAGHHPDLDHSQLPRSPLRHRQSWHPGPPPFNANPWSHGTSSGRRGDEMRNVKPFVSFANPPNIPAPTEISGRPGDVGDSRGLKHRRSFAGPYSRGLGRSQETRFSSGPRWSGPWFGSGDDEKHDAVDKLESPQAKRKQTQLGEASDDEVENHDRKNSWRYERLGEELDRPSEVLDEHRRLTESEILKNDNNGEETENDESLLLPRPASSHRSWSVSSPRPQPLLLPPRENGASPIPEMTRFPSLSQFEGSSFQRPQPFPALPSMTTLTPQNRDLENTGSLLRSTNPFATPPPQAEQHQQDEHSYLSTIPGAWPPPPPPQPGYQAQNFEATSPPSSSHAPNQRLDEISRHQPILRAWLDDHLQHPYPTEAEKQMLQLRTSLDTFQISNWFDTARQLLGPRNTNSQAQLVRRTRPLDPLVIAFPDAHEPRAPFGGPRRAATNSGAPSHSVRLDQNGPGAFRRRSLREGDRPRSEHFTGHGRLGWSTFLDSSSPRNPTSDPYPSTLPEFTAQTNREDAPVETTDHPIDEPMIDLEDAEDNRGPESDIQKCVELLKSLGFGTEEDGGMERLSVYAVAAGGDLDTALEIISEERRAWEERC